jgi:hypothetical protein
MLPLSERTFGGKDSFHSGINACGLIKGLGKAFEDGFKEMVHFPGTDHADVHIQTRIGTEGLKEFIKKPGIDIFDHGGRGRYIVVKARTS